MFALGRAQELMLILEEYWTQHPELAEVPLEFCSSMADKYLDVYQRSIEYMNDRVKGATANPFEFPPLFLREAVRHQHGDALRRDRGPRDAPERDVAEDL